MKEDSFCFKRSFTIGILERTKVRAILASDRKIRGIKIGFMSLLYL